jgi:nicotinamide mononucleotide transporter
MAVSNWVATLAIIWAGLSATEVVGALLGLVYVVLVIGQVRACWVAALLSTAVYLTVFYRAGLYMQAALQAYYMVVAVYGFWAWRATPAGTALPISRASWRVQAVGVLAVLVASVFTAHWLAAETGSADPLLDSLTTWGSVFATWLVAKKKIDNWPWWLVIDSLILVLCWRAHLYPSIILYALYLALVLIGWRQWKIDWHRQSATSTEAA